MRFVSKIAGPDERVIGVTSIHWMYGAKGLIMLTLFMLTGQFFAHSLYFLTSYIRLNALDRALAILGHYGFWIFTVIGVSLFLSYLLLMATTEIALTSKRIIFKKGFIFVRVKEVDLEEIKASSVDNGWLGAFLNYGYIYLDARFVNNLTLPAISSPYRFIKAMNEARGGLREGSIAVNVNGSDATAKNIVSDEIEENLNRKKIKTYAKDTKHPQKRVLGARRYEDPLEQGGHAGHPGRADMPISQAPVPAPMVFAREPRQYRKALRKKILAAFSRKSNGAEPVKPAASAPQ